MLYIEEKTYARQVSALRILADKESAHLCVWLYPESHRKTLANYKVVTAGELMPVTTYEDGFLPSRTELIPASDLALDSLLTHKTQIKKHCDSITLYSGNETSWYAAAIGHEGMIISHDESKLGALQSGGFNVSTEPPQWW